MSESSGSLSQAALEYRDKSLELVHEQAARIAELETALRVERDKTDLYRHLASHLTPREYREAKAKWDEFSRACDTCSRIDHDDNGDCPLASSSRPRVNCDEHRAEKP